MSSADAEPKGIAEVLRLANELAEQMMALQIMKRSIPQSQLTALIGAARFLQENDVAWPPLVQEVIREIAARMEATRPKRSNDDAVL